MTFDPKDIQAGLDSVRARITAACVAAQRAPEASNLVAVSKTHPIEALTVAIEAGQRFFGENRVQEAQAKFPVLKAEHPDLSLHLIGPLQTNKVKAAVALFDVIETVDRESLAAALSAERVRGGRFPASCLVQVNTGEEPQKAGIPPREAEAFARRCLTVHNLPIRGLMCIPPVEGDPGLHFAFLAELGKRLKLPILSMGMSGDFETAIRFGATHVRVGSAIFGHRPAA
jgi:pyridoxal phosphate enzyme (YggS family)